MRANMRRQVVSLAVFHLFGHSLPLTGPFISPLAVKDSSVITYFVSGGAVEKLERERETDKDSIHGRVQ